MALKNVKKAVGTMLIAGGIVLSGIIGYHALTTPITYKVIEESTVQTMHDAGESSKKEYFSIDGKVWYTWEKETAKTGTTYCSLLDDNGLYFNNNYRNVLIGITVQKNNTKPENIKPGQELYIPVKVDTKDVPEDESKIHLEELVSGN